MFGVLEHHYIRRGVWIAEQILTPSLHVSALVTDPLLITSETRVNRNQLKQWNGEKDA